MRPGGYDRVIISVSSSVPPPFLRFDFELFRARSLPFSFLFSTVRCAFRDGFNNIVCIAAGSALLWRGSFGTPILARIARVKNERAAGAPQGRQVLAQLSRPLGSREHVGRRAVFPRVASCTPLTLLF